MARKSTKSNRRQRRPKGLPWHRSYDNSWYVTLHWQRHKLTTVDGKPIKGAEQQQAALDAHARLRLQIQAAPKRAVDWTVARVCETYLQKVNKEDGARHLENSTAWLNNLCRFCGALSVDEFDAQTLDKWIASNPGWKSVNSIRGIVSVVLAAFNYAHRYHKKQGCPVNPIAEYKLPTGHGRIVFFTDDEIKQVLAASPNQAFADFWQFCLLTGARPSEVAKLTAEHLRQENGKTFFVIDAVEADGSYGHKAAKKTGKARVIIVPDCAVELLNKKLLAAPVGTGLTLFRSTTGAPITRSNWVQTWQRIKKATGIKKPLYTTRHTFAKWVLAGRFNGGVAQPLYVVAGLLGITQKVAEQHYAAWAEEASNPLFAALGVAAVEQVKPVADLFKLAG